MKTKSKVLNKTQRPQTSTLGGQHSWICSCQSNCSAQAVHFLTSTILRPDGPRLFPVGLCERYGLCFANTYNPNSCNIDYEQCLQKWLAFTVKCLEGRVISSGMQGIKWSTKRTQKRRKNISELPFTKYLNTSRCMPERSLIMKAPPGLAYLKGADSIIFAIRFGRILQNQQNLCVHDTNVNEGLRDLRFTH